MKRKHKPGKRHKQRRERQGQKGRGRLARADAVPTKAVCPCCGTEVPLADQKVLKSWSLHGTAVVPAIARLAAFGKYYEGHCGQERLALYWACNSCIWRRRASAANPRKQRWLDCEPYLAYFDEQRECRDCGEPFTFTKEEQRHWYEVLQFWVWSRPIRCKGCNRLRRQVP